MERSLSCIACHNQPMSINDWFMAAAYWFAWALLIGTFVGIVIGAIFLSAAILRGGLRGRKQQRPGSVQRTSKK